MHYPLQNYNPDCKLNYMNKGILAQYLNFHAEIQSLHTVHKAASIAGPVLSFLSISKGCRVSKSPVFQLSEKG